MGELEKLAAKKKITKRMAEALLGKKPREIKNLTTALGALGGVKVGGEAGGITGALLGFLAGASRRGATFKSLSNDTRFGTGMGALGGAGVGAFGGGALGRALGKGIDKVRLDKYKAKRNKRLAIGGGSAAGLAGLLTSINKSKRGKSKKASAWLRPPNPGNLVKAPKSSPSFGGPAALLNIYGAGAPMFTGKRQLARAQRPILDRYRGLRNKPKMAPTTTPSTPKPMSPAQ